MTQTFKPDDSVAQIIDMLAAQLCDPSGAFVLTVRLQMRPGSEAQAADAFGVARRQTQNEEGARAF